jgi:hypothetical protein
MRVVQYFWKNHPTMGQGGVLFEDGSGGFVKKAKEGWMVWAYGPPV